MVHYPFNKKKGDRDPIELKGKLSTFKMLRLIFFLVLQAINVFYVQYQLFHGITEDVTLVTTTLSIFFSAGIITLLFNIRIFQINVKEKHTKTMMASAAGFLILHLSFLCWDPSRNIFQFAPNWSGIILTQILATVFLWIQIPYFLRHLFVVEYAVKCKLARNDEDYAIYYELMVDAEADAGLISLFDCYLRGTPQLLQQTILIIRQYAGIIETPGFTVFDYIPIVTAFITLPWTTTSYHDSLRQKKDNSFTFVTLVIYFFWNISILGSRIISIGAAGAISPWYTGAVFLVHWLVATGYLYITLQPMEFYNRSKFGHLMFCIVFGFVYIFAPINLTEGHKSDIYFWFYLIMGCENFVALVIFCINATITSVLISSSDHLVI